MGSERRPGRPGTPIVVDSNEHFVDLIWTEPESDDPDDQDEVVGYEVYYCDLECPLSKWQLACESLENETCLDSDLFTPGKSYAFTVRSRSVDGNLSEMSSTSKHITFTSPISLPMVKWVIRPKESHCITQALQMAISVVPESVKVAFAAPSGVRLQPDEQFVYLTTENMNNNETKEATHSLKILPGLLTLGDTGKFKVKASNVAGTVELETHVEMVGPPGPPQGPLEIVVHPDLSQGRVLQWRRCSASGGSELEAYLVQTLDEDEEKSEWSTVAKVTKGLLSKKMESIVDNLKEKHTFRFRVLAENCFGQSLPLESSRSVFIRPRKIIPCKPGQPSVVETVSERGEKGLRIEWRSSAFSDNIEADGIDHFVVQVMEHFIVAKDDEQRRRQSLTTQKRATKAVLVKSASLSEQYEELTTRWTSVSTTSECHYLYPAPRIRHTYRFRVKSVTLEGEVSEASEASMPITCECNRQRPVIVAFERHREAIVGSKVCLKAEFKGDPVPIRQWSRIIDLQQMRGLPLEPDGRVVRLEDDEHSSTLIMEPFSELNVGLYEFRVENEFGQETALLDLVAIARLATEPRPPLEVIHIDNDNNEEEGYTLKCSWRASKSSGRGSQKGSVSHYVLERLPIDFSSLNNLEKLEDKWIFCGHSEMTSMRVNVFEKSPMLLFRVHAVNSDKQTSRSIMSDPIHLEMTNDTVPSAVAPAKASWSVRFQSRRLCFSLSSTLLTVVVSIKKKIDDKDIKEQRIISDMALKLDEEYVDANKFHLKLGSWRPSKSSSSTLALRCTMTLEASKVFSLFKEGQVGRLRCEIGQLGEDEIDVECCSPSIKSTLMRAKIRDETSVSLEWTMTKDVVEYALQMQKLDINNEWTKITTSSTTTTATTTTMVKSISIVKDLQSSALYLFRVVGHKGDKNFEVVAVTEEPLSMSTSMSIPMTAVLPIVKNGLDGVVSVHWESNKDAHCYRLEIRRVRQGLVSWSSLVVKENEVSLDDEMVVDGAEHRIRVVLLNQQGCPQGSSPLSEPFTPRQRARRPVIDTGRVVRSLTCLSADRVRLEVPFTSHPRPSISWWFNGCRLEPTKGVAIFKERSMAHLHFSHIRRRDSGNYVVEVSNELGGDQVEIAVNVLDRPLPPRHVRLLVDQKTVEWSEPEDDGGSAVSFYQVEGLRRNNVWSVCGRSKKCNFVLSNANEINVESSFRVIAVNKFGASDPVSVERH